MSAPFDNPDETRPNPPRFWWLKRISIGLGAYVLFLVIIRLGWGYYAESRLQNALIAWRAAGQPVSIDDLAPQPVPDKENGAWYLRQALRKLVVPTGMSNDIYWQALNVDAYRDGPGEVAQIIAANSEPLAFLRAARACTASDWGYTLRSPLTTSMNINWLSERQLARLARLAALRAEATAKDAEWVECVRDQLAFGRHLGQTEPFLMAHLTRLAIDGLAAGRVQSFCFALRVGPDVTADPTVNPATRAPVDALITDLLDENHISSGWRRSIYGERLLLLDRIPNPVARWAGLGLSPRRFAAGTLALEPAWMLGELSIMQRYSDLADAPPKRLLVCAQLERDPPRANGLISFLARGPYLLVGYSLPSVARVQLTHLATRRMAATALAIRLYEVEDGQRPTRLAELVPVYLPAVPRDPLAADGREIAYRPDADPPVLYSVGENGQDDGGRPPADSAHISLDQLFYLNGDPPRPPPFTLPSAMGPSTQAVEDDHQPQEAGEDARDQAREN